MKLYELTNQYNQIKLLDLDEEVLNDTLEALEGSIQDKADGITKLIKELELTAEARKAEAKRLVEMASKEENKVQRLKEYLDHNLKVAGITKLDTGLFKISYLKGREVVQIDEARLPQEYWIPQPSKPMSKTDLKKLIKEKEIEGVTMVRNPDTLQIK